MKRRLMLTTLVLLATCFAFNGVSSGQQVEERTAYSFSEVQSEALRLSASYGKEKVLLVFDIDNTLLAMQRDLGSDQWYAWQRSLPEHDPWRVSHLLQTQGFLYDVSSMRATEPVCQPKVVRQLQQAGFTTLLLTSRGHEFRDPTRRELLANGYDFRESTLTPRAGYPDSYSPYDVSLIEQSGISRQEAEQWIPGDGGEPFAKPRPVSYQQGVYMTAGQNKGVMLRMILHKSDNVGKYSAIVFVDDQPRHTEHVRQAFANQNVELVTFRYTREDANVHRFNENRCCEKYCATLALCRLNQSPNSANVSRLNPPIWATERVFSIH